MKLAMVWPLSSFLAEEMGERRWNAVDVAQRMPGDYAENIGIVNLILAMDDDFVLGSDVAEGLAVAFDVSAHMINGMHDTWLQNPQQRQPFECPEHLFGGIQFPEATP